MTRKEKAAERAERLRTLILAGSSDKQTAALMGMKLSSLYTYVSRLRKAGYGIPKISKEKKTGKRKNKKYRSQSREQRKLEMLKKYRPENRRYMTDGEIRQSVRLAADPEHQIGILADLNNMTKQEVHSIVSDIF